MNICVLAPENSPSWGGVGAYTFNLLKNIPTNEEIHVVTINREIEDSFDKLLNDRFIIHKIVDIDKNDSFFYNLKFQLAVFNQLNKLNKEYNFDIIHSHSGHLPHLLSQFRNLPPLVASVHATVRGLKRGINNYSFKKDKTESLMKLFSLGIEQGEKIGFRKAKFLFPVSKFTLNEMKEFYGYDEPEKTEVMYNAVDTSLFNIPKKATEEPTILFVGRLYAIKGIDVFIDALHILSKKGLKFKVLIVGRGETERVSNRLSKIMPSSKYKILGRVSYTNMPNIYSEASILVVSSISENCPTTILEAMSTKTLVVASKTGGIPEIITHNYNGFLFETGNTEELASILSKYLTNEIDSNKIVENAYNTIVESFNWNKRGKDIFEKYEEVLQ